MYLCVKVICLQDGLWQTERRLQPGYIFKGWKADAAGTTEIGSATMPASDYTVYAQWQADGSKFVVHFDSNGGSRISIRRM